MFENSPYAILSRLESIECRLSILENTKVKTFQPHCIDENTFTVGDLYLMEFLDTRQFGGNAFVVFISYSRDLLTFCSDSGILYVDITEGFKPIIRLVDKEKHMKELNKINRKIIETATARSKF